MPTPPPMPVGRKRLIKVLGSAAALAVLYFGGTFALSRFLDPDQLAGWLEPKLEVALNRDVEVGGVEVGFLPLGVTLRELMVDDPTGLAPHLARVGSLEFRVEILPLLRREVRVSRLTIEDLQADLRVGEGGISNFGDFSSQRSVDQVEQARHPFSLDLRGIRLVESRIQYSSTPDAFTAEIDGVGLRATARQNPGGGWTFAGSSDADFTLQRGEADPLLDGTPLEISFEVETDGGFDRVHIRAGFPGEEEGSLAADLRVEGEAGPGHLPTVTGHVGLTARRVTLNGEPLAETLTAELDLLPERSVRARAQATLLGGPFSLEGTLAAHEGVDFVLEANPELGRLGSMAELPEGMTIIGRAPTQVRLTGPVGNLRNLRFNGEVRPSGIRITHPSLGVPLEVTEGTLQLSGTRASVQGLPVTLGDDRLSLTGELSDVFALLDPEATPQLTGSIRGPRLDLNKLSARPFPNSTLTYGKVAFAKVGGRLVGGRSFEDAAEELGLVRPAALPVAGSIDMALDTVLDRKGRMERVRARVDFGPDFLRVSEASFSRYGGEIRTSANLALAPDGATPFSFSLQVFELDASGFLSQNSSLGRFVRGKISVDLDLIGTLDGLLLPDRPALVGSGSFSLTSGGLATAPLTQGLSDFLGLDDLREPSIQDWGTSFVLEQGRVRLADATVQGAPGSPRVGGSVGLDGGLDLQSVFSLPSDQLSTSALERLGVIGEIAAAVAQRPEVVQAVLRIGGSVFDPAIHADPRATALTLGEAVREEVTEEVQEQIDAQQAEAQRRIEEQRDRLQNRATGFLRDLIQRPDTVRPDSTPRDTVRPDTVRPDTIRPDTVRPDTARGFRLAPSRPSRALPETPGHSEE